MVRPRTLLAVPVLLALAGAPAAGVPAGDKEGAGDGHHHAGSHDPHHRKGASPHDATSSHPFDDVEKWVDIFDDPARDAWQKPAEVVAALGLEPGQAVVDLGAGTGYFLERLSRAVGSEGTVWALDTEPRMVEHLVARANRDGFHNVRARVCPTDSTGLPAASADVVLIVDTFHHFNDRLTYLRRLRSVLKPGGRVAVVDWDRASPPPPGPPADHRLTRDHIVSEFRETGWVLVAEHGFLPHQVYLVFAPAPGAADEPG